MNDDLGKVRIKDYDGLVFIEGVRLEEEILTMKEVAALNACAKRRGIKGSSYTGSKYTVLGGIKFE